MTVPAPNPGSPEAVTHGCVCPALDNHNGVRAPSGGWWVNADCPLHDPWPPDHGRGAADAWAAGYKAAHGDVERDEEGLGFRVTPNPYRDGPGGDDG